MVLDHVDVIHRRCQHPGCSKHPAFGDPAERKALFCKKHKRPDHINLLRQLCRQSHCFKSANPASCFEGYCTDCFVEAFKDDTSKFEAIQTATSRCKTERMLYEHLHCWMENNNAWRLDDARPGHVTFDWISDMRRFDFAMQSNAITLILELDGSHHFADVPFWNSSALDVAAADGEKCRLALANGAWVVRYGQRWVWTSLGGAKSGEAAAWQSAWQLYHDRAIQLVARGGCPKVILPAELRESLYDLWQTRSGLRKSQVAWL